jgi:hypothetical protein
VKLGIEMVAKLEQLMEEMTVDKMVVMMVQ